MQSGILRGHVALIVRSLIKVHSAMELSGLMKLMTQDSIKERVKSFMRCRVA